MKPTKNDRIVAGIAAGLSIAALSFGLPFHIYTIMHRANTFLGLSDGAAAFCSGCTAIVVGIFLVLFTVGALDAALSEHPS